MGNAPETTRCSARCPAKTHPEGASELAERLDILGDFYRRINIAFNFKDPYKLDPEQKYTWQEIVDRRLKGYFGPERGLDWLRKTAS